MLRKGPVAHYYLVTDEANRGKKRRGTLEFPFLSLLHSLGRKASIGMLENG